ncbi:MAG TPA: M23 family metallopeptidase [Methylomirabilota bacterium]
MRRRVCGGSLAAAAVVLLAAGDGAARERPPAGAPPVPAASRVHVVARGETLRGIAARYRVTVAALVVANRLPGEHFVLRVGRRLVIPLPGAIASTPARKAAPVVARPRAPSPPRPRRGPRGLELTVPDFVDSAPPFVWPIDGPVTSTFGRRRSGWHRGIDIKAERGSVVFAAAAGIVVVAGVEPRYGRVVKIEHDDDFLTVYAHNEENLVAVGARVAAGDPIATIGRTGRATAHHLHFEIRRGVAVYNPLYLLPLPPRVGQVDLSDESGEDHE